MYAAERAVCVGRKLAVGEGVPVTIHFFIFLRPELDPLPLPLAPGLGISLRLDECVTVAGLHAGGQHA